ncbi:GH92 family glycosyl hydrolase [Dokdonella soli]
MNLARALVLALACAACSPFARAQETTAPSDLPKQVNTFIGTKDDGNTFPGASAPFGLIQVSPIGEHYAGWRYDDPKIRGFGHSFISGAGCWEQGGQLSVLPVTGAIGPGGTFDIKKADRFDQKNYSAAYTHAGEIGEAGYYKVHLTAAPGHNQGGIDAEATALTRAAAERYTFAAGEKQGHILVNAGQANERHWVIGSSVQVVGDRAVEGRILTKSFCGGQQYVTWFRMEFDRPFSAFGTWDEEGGTPSSRVESQQGDGRPHGAWFTFDLKDGRAITAISAISHVDAEGARNNLRADGMRNGKLQSFDAMRTRAQEVWRKELNSVRIAGGNADDRAVFYTALYHSLLQPLTGSDADGRYRGYDTQVHRADGWTYYEYFSLWDIYRAQNQLLAMLRPQRARDIANSVLMIQQQGGWLPRWSYANFETNVMTGDPVTPFLVDLWRFGALEGRERQAYAALRQNAFGVPPALSRSSGRAGNESYLSRGFVQYDRSFPAKSMDVDPHHGGSATLEYALADCALAQMADAIGEKSDAATLRERGRNWRKVWDPGVVDKELGFKGFPRPRLTDGSWYVAPDGAYSPRSNHGFHEGTAWQYQWLVQQDAQGMIEAMGGRESAGRRLDAFFAYDELVKDPLHAARKQWVVGPYDYYNQFRYNPNNEPDLHSPWMYTLVGQPSKTATVLRAAQALFTNAPDGVTGNDDLGTMSAWYLFSAIGVFPAVPGSGQLLLHTPRFERIDIDLGNGHSLRIAAPGADGRKLQYIQGLTIDAAAHEQVWVDWQHLRVGGSIAFKLTEAPPTQGWGTAVGAAPRSPCAESR